MLAAGEWVKGQFDHAALRLAVVPWAVAKVLTVAVVTLAVFAQSTNIGHPTWGELLAPFAYWDGQNYTTIAAHGYPPGPLDLTPGHPGHLWGFFPGYPMLVTVFFHLGMSTTVSGVLVSAVAELIALYYLVRLVEAELDREAARFAAWLLALWPDAMDLSMVYGDSTFLAAAAASLYYMRRGDNGRACLCAAVAIAVRITAVALIPALLIEYLRRRSWRPGPGLLLIGATVLPLVGFGLYAHAQTGDWLAYSHVASSASYGSRAITWPWTALANTWHLAFGNQPSGFAILEILDLIFGLGGLAALVYMWSTPRIPASLAAFSTVSWLLPASLAYWAGMPRYAMHWIPVFIVIADLTKRAAGWRPVVIAVSAALMGYGVSIIAIGHYLE